MATAMSNQINHVDSEEKQCADQLKHWLETEAQFYGRTDEDFLIMFVRWSKRDLEKAKKKLHMYYEIRKKAPQWWANRDSNEFKHFYEIKGLTLFPDKDPQLPAFGIIRFSKAPKSVQFDAFIKMLTICMDIVMRRTNCQLNGLVGIVDCADYPLWILQTALSPIAVYNIIQGFYMAMPLRLKAVHLVNFPLVGRAAWRLIRAFLPAKIRNRFFLYGSDLTALKDNIDNRLLPEEYGGPNGRLVDHAETFLEEVYSYSDYILDDNKYGFQ